MFKKFTPKGIFAVGFRSIILNNRQKKEFIENKTYKIMNFCTDFNFANLENKVFAMLTYEKENLVINLLVKKGREHFGIELKNNYQEVFGVSLYLFEISSWNSKSEFYTVFKFKE